jgi:flagellar motor switch protein FliM
MSRILSQDEIDSLLSAAITIGGAEPGAGRRASGNAVPYNFRRPDRISKEQIHSLYFLHDRFARNVATSLSAYLRTMSEVSVVSVEQFSYSEFLLSLSDPTSFYALAIPPYDELGALEINPSLAFAIVDRMLGGPGTTPPLARALTEIEQNVIDSLVKLLLESLAETWRPIVNLAFGIRGRETRPQMLQVAAPNEIVIMVVFDTRIGDARGMLSLCFPASIVESAGGHFVQAWHQQKREPTPAERAWLRENLARVRMPLTASLDAWMSTRALLELRSGSVLTLGLPADRLVDVFAGDTLKFKGRLGASGNQVDLEVAHRCNPLGEIVEA